MKKHFFSAGVVLYWALTIAPLAGFAELARPNPDMEASVKPALTRAASLELPATAARLVISAKSADKQGTALAIIRVVAKLNPPALPSVVAAIAKAQPALAAKVADEAARLQPKLKAQIGEAATLKTTIANGPTLPDPTFVGEPSPLRLKTTIANGPTSPDPVFVGEPTPTTRKSEPQPTSGEGKKKGHYKRPD